MSNHAVTDACAFGLSFSSTRASSALPTGQSVGGAAAPVKAPRAMIRRLKVVTEICPQVFLRTLDLMAQRGIVPLSINYEQRRTRLYFEIEVEGVSEAIAATLAAKVAEFVRVRSARWVLPRRQ